MPVTPTTATHTHPATASPYRAALGMLASLFFIWGFITVINGTLLPHLRSVFDLSYTQTTLIESVWFIAYFVASIPSAKLIEGIGYQKSLVVGLLVMAAGSVGMMLAASIPSYGVTLAMLFVIASGITLLQVAANPYVAVIGTPETSSSRLNLVQAFNSLGTVLAPLFGAYLILGRSVGGTAEHGTVLTQAERLADAQSVILPYVPGRGGACRCWRSPSRASAFLKWAMRPSATPRRNAAGIRCGGTAIWCSACPRSSSI